MALDELFTEAKRQLDICNSCRYCAGYCPAWRSLERKVDLTKGEITQISNLCHDCRDCFTACMYTAPHEFDLNPPKVFTEVREQSYREYVWPGKLPAWANGWAGVSIALVLATILLSVISFATGDRSVWFASTEGNPYDVIGHYTLVVSMIVPLVFAFGVFFWGLGRYWRAIHGGPGGIFNLKAWAAAFEQSATLAHMSGGEEGCNYEDGEPGTKRKLAHHLVMWGFMLTFFATISAGFQEYVLGGLPPYPIISVPVLSGTIGGIAATIGCIMLLRIKPRSDREQTTETMYKADLGLIWSLLFLMISGLLTTLFRTTPAFAPLLIAHLAAVGVAFLIFPYTKFVHVPYRILAVYQDNVELLEAEEKRKAKAAA